ncbi:MAG: phospho-N-acetylmuramoyl-pentapeptide-transferase [Lachnospiraceae bacterium]|nr:phospho-N-acetylmuramoyl-pentapeptide-transferase [Lachnospiraceae bacterium]
MLGYIFRYNMNILFIVGSALTFICTALALGLLKKRLPQDHGREFAVNGDLSKGKARGAVIILIGVLVLMFLIFVPSVSMEYPLYCLFLVLAMLTGFLDDAAKKSWNEYLKGALDLVIALGTAFTFYFFNSSKVSFMLIGAEVTLPAWLFILLEVILIWVSINVVNCTDGVDGLCATLSIVTIIGFLMVYRIEYPLSPLSILTLMFIMMLLAYLLFNSSPSSILMGDAGSRPIGLFIALLALKTDPILFIPFAFVFILDGGLGLIKVSLLRFLKISIMKNIRTPLHDHFRKVKDWSDTQTVFRFAVVQAFVIILIIAWFSMM